MERTAQNRVIFGAGTKKKKSRNPHGYWIFRWRRVWDSNPRALADNRISSAARYDHFDNSPSMFSRRFSLPFSDRKRLWKELTERTTNLFNFRTVENPRGYKVFGGRNGQLPARFRVFYQSWKLAENQVLNWKLAYPENVQKSSVSGLRKGGRQAEAKARKM